MSTRSNGIPLLGLPGGEFDRALQAVSRQFDIPTDLLLSKRRFTEVAEARWVVMRILHVKLKKTLSETARRLGLDHGTVINGLSRSTTLEGIDSNYKAKCAAAFKTFDEKRQP